MSDQKPPGTNLPYGTNDGQPAKKPNVDDYKPLTDDLPVRDFVEMIQYLRECPQVTVIVGDSSYTLSKGLLCAKSTFFDRAFNNGFLETNEQTVNLAETTAEIFELVIQWIYKGKLSFPTALKKPALVDRFFGFFQLADVLDLCGPLDDILASLKAIILEDSDFLRPAHVRVAYELPNGHYVRQLVVKASVIRYIDFKRKGGDFMYQREMDEFIDFKVDLLEAVAQTYRTTRGHKSYGREGMIEVRHPLTREWVEY